MKSYEVSRATLAMLCMATMFLSLTAFFAMLANNGWARWGEVAEVVHAMAAFGTMFVGVIVGFRYGFKPAKEEDPG